MKIYVVLLPVKTYERSILEDIENQIFPTYDELIKTLSLQERKTNKELSGFYVYKLSDFMDMWNNEDEDITEIEEKLADHWFGYFRVQSKIVPSHTYNTSVGELINMLENYPLEMGITDEQNREFVHIVNDDSRVILSTNKPIGICNRTGTYVYPTVVEGYSAFCPELDEDLCNLEWTEFDLFNSLEKVEEPLRTILKDINDVKDFAALEKLKQVAEIYGYTFDIDCGSVSKLRKI